MMNLRLIFPHTCNVWHIADPVHEHLTRASKSTASKSGCSHLPEVDILKKLVHEVALVHLKGHKSFGVVSQVQ